MTRAAKLTHYGWKSKPNRTAFDRARTAYWSFLSKSSTLRTVPYQTQCGWVWIFNRSASVWQPCYHHSSLYQQYLLLFHPRPWYDSYELPNTKFLIAKCTRPIVTCTYYREQWRLSHVGYVGKGNKLRSKAFTNTETRCTDWDWKAWT